MMTALSKLANAWNCVAQAARWWIDATREGDSRLEKLREKILVQRQPIKCCGIVGYIGSAEAKPILLQGIKILQNRGYDSCGICTISSDNSLVTTKFASQNSTSDCIELLVENSRERHIGHRMGIGHTRWATHGGKVDVNAHPLHDHTETIAVVHNGTIDNYLLLKKKLLSENIAFRSETDTEVIANLISWHLQHECDIEGALQAACAELEGTWGLAVLHKDYPSQILLARNGSPLLVGMTEKEVFVASEITALANHTNQYFALHDGESCVVKIGDFHHLNKRLKHASINPDSILLTAAPYSHWTLREIYEQPESMQRAINHGGRISLSKKSVKLGGLDSSKYALLKIKNLIMTGSGTSFYAAMYGERLMRSLRCFDVVMSCDASELTEDLLPQKDGGMLLLTQSGETLDVIRAFQLGERCDLTMFSVVNVVGSHLARLTDCGVYINAGREVAVASTKAFTSQVIVLSLISIWFAQQRRVRLSQRQHILSSIQRLSEYTAMILKNHDSIRILAEKLKYTRSMFILGKGFGYCAALEGALKIKEISYIHAEGVAAGNLKHGPFALIDSEERTPVVLILLDDGNLHLVRTAAEQVKARGALVIGITDSKDTTLQSVLHERIQIPSLGYMTGLLATVILQLLAFELAIKRGVNPDKPRGLAKTVTVA